MLINTKARHWRPQNGQTGKLKVVLGRKTCSLILQISYKTLFPYVSDTPPHLTQSFLFSILQPHLLTLILRSEHNEKSFIEIDH